ncbi:MAG TPA: hypothetical protein VGY54_22130 [Polyangiaceae bacterium]|jgi:hypothetical protein|nr:hypothetical protein [Polyangiaceae bacterium]
MKNIAIVVLCATLGTALALAACADTPPAASPSNATAASSAAPADSSAAPAASAAPSK